VAVKQINDGTQYRLPLLTTIALFRCGPLQSWLEATPTVTGEPKLLFRIEVMSEIERRNRVHTGIGMTAILCGDGQRDRGRADAQGVRTVGSHAG